MSAAYEDYVNEEVRGLKDEMAEDEMIMAMAELHDSVPEYADEWCDTGRA